ncbi:MAG: transporter substrate-binding domain-containing protein [Pseudonocardiaceae bacterium]|nr:transporter substrate-binding domain-containing protein [Pseudonocardiaceae bacterium]
MAFTRLAAGCLAGLLAITMTGCVGGPGTDAAGDGSPRTLRIAHNSNAAALPAQVAAKQGFFRKHNLKVEFTKIENIGSVPGTLGRSFDVALSAPTTVISAAQQGIAVTQVAGATIDVKDNPTGFLIGSRKAGTTSVTQLEGKTLGVLTETGTVHIATRAWLKQQGVDPESVKIVEVDGPAQADQLASGRIDAVETVMPFAAKVLQDNDTTSLGDPYLKLAPELSAIFWISQQRFAQQHPGVLTDFRAALDDARDYIGAHEDKARQVLKEYTGLPDPVIKNTTLPTYTSEVRPDDLKIWLKTMQDVGELHGDVDLGPLATKQE